MAIMMRSRQRVEFWLLVFVALFPTTESFSPRWLRLLKEAKTSRSSSQHRKNRHLFAELGELAAPRLPRWDADLVEAARKPLSWETCETFNSSLSTADSSSSSEATNSMRTRDWESGEIWLKTRLTLVNLWILPRDMSNGADEDYAMAAEQKELKVLQAVPQLLRLDDVMVIATAKMLLNQAGLAPAVLRREPRLLTYPPDHVESALKALSVVVSGGVDNEKEKNRGCRQVIANAKVPEELLMNALDNVILASNNSPRMV